MPATERDRRYSAILGDELAGERVDRALPRLLPSCSRREIQELCAAGRVRIGGRQVKKSDLLVAGAHLEVEFYEPRVATPIAGHLDIRFESANWVIVAKPALLPTAPRRGEETGTLVNALLAAYPEMAGIGHRALEPGLLHRLDNGTSGLLVSARTQEAFELGTRALKQSLWKKSYLALVDDEQLPTSGILRGRLEPWPEQPRRVRATSGIALEVRSPESLTHTALSPFETAYITLQRTGNRRLVRVFVGPAYRHQIRAHFAAVGAPLLNDEVYGATREPNLPRERHALHAARVAWVGTTGLPGFDVDLPLADDLLALATALGPYPSV